MEQADVSVRSNVCCRVSVVYNGGLRLTHAWNLARAGVEREAGHKTRISHQNDGGYGFVVVL